MEPGPASGGYPAANAYVGALVDELARSGVTDAVFCPGSRSAPLAIALARHPDVTLWPHLDERSAAFFALGLARGRGRPVALVSTSGTAAANFFPAVVEARYGRVPLLVLTADRPPELRDVGAPQAIDQLAMYGGHAKWFVELALPGATADALRYVRSTAARAAGVAATPPAGPVHVNLPFREPLVPVPGPGPWPPDSAGAAPEAWAGRPGARPYARTLAAPRILPAGATEDLARSLLSAPRGLIVCGPQDDADFPEAAVRLAGALGYPVLADPLSGVRCGRHERRLVLDAYDPLLRHEAVTAPLAPEMVLRFGAPPTSKPLLQYLTRHAAARQVLVDPAEGWRDPALVASDVVWADGRALADALAGAVERLRKAGEAPPGPDPGWANAWVEADRQARGALAAFCAGLEEPFEGKVFAELAALLPDGATLFAGNSMPVRDLDAFFHGSGREVRLMANRGANGIDGVVSTALGAAAAGLKPLVLVIGDLSFYHDMNGLLAARRHRLDATIVLLHNDGGGIFSFLPQADYPEVFELLFGTPHGLDFAPVAELYGARYVRADTWPAFRTAVADGVERGGLSVVEVRTGRRRNVDLHRDAWRAVAAALAGGEVRAWPASG